MKIVPLKIKPNQDAIQVLESILEKAKVGEIAAVSIAYVNKDNSIGGNTSSGDNNFAMWASLEHLARTFYNDLVSED